MPGPPLWIPPIVILFFSPKDKCYPYLQYELTSVVISAFHMYAIICYAFLCVWLLLINNICLRIICLDAYGCCILVHCTVIPQFIHPFWFWWTFGLLPVCDNYKQCFCGASWMHVYTHEYMCIHTNTCVYILLSINLEAKLLHVFTIVNTAHRFSEWW